MLTPIQKRKLTRYFNILDQNMNGILEESDFREIVENLTTLRGYKKGSEAYQYVENSIMMIWENARAIGQAKNPDFLTLEEWLHHEDVILSDEEIKEGYMRKITRDVFDLVDANGDGVIQFQEYADILKAFRVEDGIAEFSFEKMCPIQDAGISRDEFVSIVEEFHLSQDPASGGNYLFGPF